MPIAYLYLHLPSQGRLHRMGVARHRAIVMLGATLGGLNQAEIEAGLFLLRLHAFELVIVCCHGVERARCLRVASRIQGQPECVWLIVSVSTPRSGHHMPSTKPLRRSRQGHRHLIR